MQLTWWGFERDLFIVYMQRIPFGLRLMPIKLPFDAFWKIKDPFITPTINWEVEELSGNRQKTVDRKRTDWKVSAYDVNNNLASINYQSLQGIV